MDLNYLMIRFCQGSKDNFEYMIEIYTYINQITFYHNGGSQDVMGIVV